MSTSTSAMVADDPTVIDYIPEADLPEPIETITDEEYAAFLWSVSPHTTEFDLPDDGFQHFVAQMLTSPDYNVALAECPQEPAPTLFDDLTPSSALQPSVAPMTPSQFVLGFGYEPKDFACLQNPPASSEADLWNYVVDELLEKFTEWVHDTDMSIAEMKLTAEDIAQFNSLPRLPAVAPVR